jgi:hypothetical protein
VELSELFPKKYWSRILYATTVNRVGWSGIVASRGFCETPDSTSETPKRITPQRDEHLPSNSMVGVVNIPPSGSPAGILLGVVGFG